MRSATCSPSIHCCQARTRHGCLFSATTARAGPNWPARITVDEVMDAIPRIIALAGENPLDFGTHSLHIGGCTALFAAGADMTVIRTMGRWSSDAYQLYVRACFERCCSWSKKAGSADVTDIEGTIDEVEYY